MPRGPAGVDVLHETQVNEVLFFFFCLTPVTGDPVRRYSGFSRWENLWTFFKFKGPVGNIDRDLLTLNKKERGLTFALFATLSHR